MLFALRLLSSIKVGIFFNSIISSSRFAPLPKRHSHVANLFGEEAEGTSFPIKQVQRPSEKFTQELALSSFRKSLPPCDLTDPTYPSSVKSTATLLLRVSAVQTVTVALISKHRARNFSGCSLSLSHPCVQADPDWIHVSDRKD